MKYYYDFGYFFSNKDSGSLRVTTTEPLDADDTDECVEYALKHNLIDEECAGNIIYVEQLTKEDARDMGFDVDDDESPSKEPVMRKWNLIVPFFCRCSTFEKKWNRIWNNINSVFSVVFYQCSLVPVFC